MKVNIPFHSLVEQGCRDLREGKYVAVEPLIKEVKDEEVQDRR